MKAILLQKYREVLSDEAFYEIVLWHLPDPMPGSEHRYKYRLALVVRGDCVLRYDNERGKGDHRHINGREEPIAFTDLKALLRSFRDDMERIMT
ncbi:toxin-antitoxin system TumE family protein [Rhizobium sp. C4]|uniref:toxin-antitoxin system TumE family protein n=1 Tax=Rhizobium sp. C4 TaxID=1349800 RepID=UPI001E450D15|nr:DUF6516 family protein [Rhizobium sp. C4]MCD2173099.1 DUF6516 family protein [Rhizobium sp. C4]